MKPNLLLLHGALGSAQQLQPLAQLLAAQFTVHTLDFAGHGGRALEPAAFTMPHFAQEISRFIAEKGLTAVHVFGYSMGGYAALVAATKQPQIFRSITTLGTKFDWSPEGAAAETQLLNPEKIEVKVPQFAEHLQRLHAPTPWAEVVTATAAMMRALGETPALHELNMSQLTVPVQVLVGELDKTAGVEDSRQFATYLTNGTLEVLPATPHPLDRADTAALAQRIEQFATAHA
ncbi:alpha/beta hydrolase [Hymenobacter busanensis]|uniref:Alpha/beta hydrolase n=1 Tax=Hymenobacter busanensis TaxID=2607656 RepID=A0A7L4ZT19_9BACT|nr:alpha/beta fold hydrolase [Hymenobacter busanensis]KAA9327588.1 alpha/beta hydrolase [Hymenobacter busanensis]QHJ06073.1 alpha/beta fold hydrolase [Hymenobacter busanensis]